jgi:hypothetical protein
MMSRMLMQAADNKTYSSSSGKELPKSGPGLVGFLAFKNSRQKPKTNSIIDDLTISEVARPKPSNEGRDPQDSNVPCFGGRCNITVSRPLKAEEESEEASISSALKSCSQRTASSKNVRFHRYDEVVYTDAVDYVYSLSERQMEREREREGADYDLLDNVEEVVGDVTYFFRCLKEGLAEEAAEKFANGGVFVCAAPTAIEFDDHY